MKVAVLFSIVNYGTPNHVIFSLEKLFEERKEFSDFIVHVVDNHSPDDSVEKIQSKIKECGWGKWVTLIPSKINGGFAYGNNLALNTAKDKEIDFDYFWLLNPDSYICEGAVQNLVSEMKGKEGIGIIGTKVMFEDHRLFGSAFRFPGIISEFTDQAKIGPISKLFKNYIVSPVPPVTECSTTNWVSGASMVITKEAIESAGLMDEEYFLYYEEVDYCLKVANKGFQNIYLPSVVVVHEGGVSTGVTGKKSRLSRVPDYWFASRARYFRKNYGNAYLYMANAACILGCCLWKVRRTVQGKEEVMPPNFLSDFIRNSF